MIRVYPLILFLVIPPHLPTPPLIFPLSSPPPRPQHYPLFPFLFYYLHFLCNFICIFPPFFTIFLQIIVCMVCLVSLIFLVSFLFVCFFAPCFPEIACLVQQGWPFFLLHATLLPIRSHGSVISKYNDVTQTQFDGDARCCRPRTRLWTRCIEWYWPTSHCASGQPQCSIHCQASEVLWMRPAIFTMLRSELIRGLCAHCPGSQAVEDIQLCLKIPKRLCLNASYSTMHQKKNQKNTFEILQLNSSVLPTCC